MHEGRLWLENPKLGNEALMSLNALATDGALIKEKAYVEYEVGSGAAHPPSTAVDQAHASMKNMKRQF